MRHTALVRNLMILSVLALAGCRNSGTSSDPGISSNGNNTGNAATTADANSNASGYSSAPNAPAASPQPAARAPDRSAQAAAGQIFLFQD